MLTIAMSGLNRSLQHHNDNLINVFDRLTKYNLKLIASKCVLLLKPEVVYLGYLITKNGIKTDN